MSRYNKDRWSREYGLEIIVVPIRERSRAQVFAYRHPDRLGTMIGTVRRITADAWTYQKGMEGTVEDAGTAKSRGAAVEALIRKTVDTEPLPGQVFP